MRFYINTKGFVFLLFVFTVSCIGSISDTNIQGAWKGHLSDEELSVVFKSDYTCVLKYFDEQSGEVQTVSGIYELDFSKKPVPLSIRKIPELSYQLHTIVEFIGSDSIRIAPFSTKWRLRPISFEPGNTINLKRI